MPENVHVRKETVLSTLRCNKEIHRKEYEEAMKGWVEKAIVAVTKVLGELKSDKARDAKVEVYLPKPMTYEKEYDKAIKMIELEVRDEVEISTSDFERFFLDEWSWKRDFLSNTGIYKNQ